MNKKLTVALSGGAALALALTGCGDNSAQTNAWAKKVCDQVQPQVGKIQQANNSISEAGKGKKSSAEVKKADSAAFQQISGAYKSLASAVKGAGTPPVAKGSKLQKDAVKELNRISSKYAGLSKSVDGLNTKDAQKFAKGLQGLAGKLDTLGRSGDKALSKLQAGELGKAMAKQKGCKRAGASPAGA